MPTSYPQTQQDVRREQDNERRKKRGEAADAAADSQINEGDLGAAGRANKAKQGIETTPIKNQTPPMDTMPIKPGPGATLGEIGEYNRKMKAIKERQALSGMSAGSQAKALK